MSSTAIALQPPPTSLLMVSFCSPWLVMLPLSALHLAPVPHPAEGLMGCFWANPGGATTSAAPESTVISMTRIPPPCIKNVIVQRIPRWLIPILLCCRHPVGPVVGPRGRGLTGDQPKHGLSGAPSFLRNCSAHRSHPDIGGRRTSAMGRLRRGSSALVGGRPDCSRRFAWRLHPWRLLSRTTRLTWPRHRRPTLPLRLFHTL